MDFLSRTLEKAFGIKNEVDNVNPLKLFRCHYKAAFIARQKYIFENDFFLTL